MPETVKREEQDGKRPKVLDKGAKPAVSGKGKKLNPNTTRGNRTGKFEQGIGSHTKRTKIGPGAR